MAEYYPLLAKAVASLPNSTLDSRKLVYERARKALIGQLRTLHPPVPDDDIARESDALDRAIERLEGELSASAVAASAASPVGPPTPAPAPFVPPQPVLPQPRVGQPTTAPPVATAAANEQGKTVTPATQVDTPARFPASGGGLGPSISKPFQPLRTKIPVAKPAAKAPVPDPVSEPPAAEQTPVQGGVATSPVAAAVTPDIVRPDPVRQDLAASDPTRQDVAREPSQPDATAKPQRIEPRRPFAPQPPKPKGGKRPLWIIPAGIAVVVLLVGFAAYKLRDKPNLMTRAKPAEQAVDAGKIVERVGGPETPSDGAPRKSADQAANADTSKPQADPASANPPATVAGRAALLVEAPDEPNTKVKTYLGTVVWRLDNVSDGQNQAVGLAVRADVDLPDDKLKVSILFQKNAETSLPASHTMKVRFMVQSGSATGNVKQINVPQMRREDSATGDSLDGVSVSIVDNSFLIGLTPGNSEAVNLDLLRAREWIDIPILLANSKIAKLTFEKTAAGQRDIQEAITAWAKQ